LGSFFAVRSFHFSVNHFQDKRLGEYWVRLAFFSSGGSELDGTRWNTNEHGCERVDRVIAEVFFIISSPPACRLLTCRPAGAGTLYGFYIPGVDTARL
jgi:hypothetical protein